MKNNLFAGFCLILLTVTAQAQSIKPGLDDKWQFCLGLFSQNNDSYLFVASVLVDYRMSGRWTLGTSYQPTDIDLDISRLTRDSQYDLSLDDFSLQVKCSIPSIKSLK